MRSRGRTSLDNRRTAAQSAPQAGPRRLIARRAIEEDVLRVEIEPGVEIAVVDRAQSLRCVLPPTAATAASTSASTRRACARNTSPSGKSSTCMLVSRCARGIAKALRACAGTARARRISQARPIPQRRTLARAPRPRADDGKVTPASPEPRARRPRGTPSPSRRRRAFGPCPSPSPLTPTRTPGSAPARSAAPPSAARGAREGPRPPRCPRCQRRSPGDRHTGRPKRPPNRLGGEAGPTRSSCLPASRRRRRGSCAFRSARTRPTVAATENEAAESRPSGFGVRGEKLSLRGRWDARATVSTSNSHSLTTHAEPAA